MCGVYPRDVAETKLMQVINQARAQEFPQLKLEELMIDIKTATMLVKRVITGLPIEIYDDETGEVSSVPDYELCTPRPEETAQPWGGSANITLAFNLLYQKIIASNWKVKATDLDNVSLTKVIHEAMQDPKDKIVRMK